MSFTLGVNVILNYIPVLIITLEEIINIKNKIKTKYLYTPAILRDSAKCWKLGLADPFRYSCQMSYLPKTSICYFGCQ